jgi:hypothetical protein
MYRYFMKLGGSIRAVTEAIEWSPSECVAVLTFVSDLDALDTKTHRVSLRTPGLREIVQERKTVVAQYGQYTVMSSEQRSSSIFIQSSYRRTLGALSRPTPT